MVSSHTCQSFQLKSIASRGWTRLHYQVKSITSQKQVGGKARWRNEGNRTLFASPQPTNGKQQTKNGTVSHLLAQIKQRIHHQKQKQKMRGCQAARSLRGPMFNDLEQPL